MKRLVDKPSRTHFVPVWDCPNCGAKDQPLSTKGPYIKEGFPEIWISFCSACDIVPEDESKIKGYASFAWLTERGWGRIQE